MPRRPSTPLSAAAPPDGGACPLCGRPLVPGPSVNQHHIVPRSQGGRDTVTLHRICHDKIHALFSDRDLAALADGLDGVRRHPDMAAFLGWVRRKPPEFTDGHHTPRRRR